jgi:hypothetical protein
MRPYQDASSRGSDIENEMRSGGHLDLGGFGQYRLVDDIDIDIGVGVGVGVGGLTDSEAGYGSGGA